MSEDTHDGMTIEIAEKLMDWKCLAPGEGYWDHAKSGGYIDGSVAHILVDGKVEPWYPTEFLEDAVEIIKRVNLDFSLKKAAQGNEYMAKFAARDGRTGFTGYSENPEIAICHAAIQYIRRNKNTDEQPKEQIEITIGVNQEAKRVVIAFSEPVPSVAWTAEEARQLATRLRRLADQIEE